MTDGSGPQVPAGWYPDPWGAPQNRWWDGSAWTHSLDGGSSDAGASADATAAAATATATATASATSRRALREQSEHGVQGGQSEHGVERGQIDHGEQAEHSAESAPATDTPAPVSAAAAAAATPMVANPGLTDTAVAAPLMATPLPPLTQSPQFTPEPVSVLAPPVFTDPEPPAAPELAEPDLAAHAPAEPAPAAPAASIAATGMTATATRTTTTTAPTPMVPSFGPKDDWAASLATWDDLETAVPVPDAVPIFGDAPPVTYNQRAVNYHPPHGRTSGVWLIVFMPIIQFAAMVGSFFLFPALITLDSTNVEVVTPEEAQALQDWSLFAIGPLSIAFYLFTIILGFQDRARLRLLGHNQTASPWWILLSPFIYLIVRSVRVRQCTGKRGSLPLLVYVCLYIAPPVAIFVAAVVSTAIIPALPG